jgi:hypothetical protein
MTPENRTKDLTALNTGAILEQVNRHPVTIEMLRAASVAVAALQIEPVSNEDIIRAVFDAVAEDVDDEDQAVLTCAAVDARVRAYFRTVQSPQAVLFFAQPALWLSHEALSVVAGSQLFWRDNRYVFNDRTFCAQLLAVVPPAGAA